MRGGLSVRDLEDLASLDFDSHVCQGSSYYKNKRPNPQQQEMSKQVAVAPKKARKSETVFVSGNGHVQCRLLLNRQMTPLWSQELVPDPLNNSTPVYTTHLYDSRSDSLLCVCKMNLIALSAADGRELYRVPIPYQPSPPTLLRWLGSLSGSLFRTDNYPAAMTLLPPTHSVKRRKQQLSNTLIVGTCGHLHAFNVQNGKLKWSNALDGNCFGAVLVLSAGRHLFASAGGSVHCVDAKSGKSHWTCRVDKATNGTNGLFGFGRSDAPVPISMLLVKEEGLLLLGAQGWLIAVGLADGSLLGEMPIDEPDQEFATKSREFSHVIFARCPKSNRVFVASGTSIEMDQTAAQDNANLPFFVKINVLCVSLCNSNAMNPFASRSSSLSCSTESSCSSSSDSSSSFCSSPSPLALVWRTTPSALRYPRPLSFYGATMSISASSLYLSTSIEICRLNLRSGQVEDLVNSMSTQFEKFYTGANLLNTIVVDSKYREAIQMLMLLKDWFCNRSESGFDATDVIQYIMRFYKRLVSVSPYFLSGDLGKLYVIDFENKVRKYEIELATEKENIPMMLSTKSSPRAGSAESSGDFCHAIMQARLDSHGVKSQHNRVNVMSALYL